MIVRFGLHIAVAFFALYEVHDIWSVTIGFAMCVCMFF